TAIFALDPLLCHSVMVDIAHQPPASRPQVPLDLSLVTFDDAPRTRVSSLQLAALKLTTLKRPMDQLARRAVRQLVARLGRTKADTSADPPEIVEYPVTVEFGDSVANRPLPTDDQHSRLARRYQELASVVHQSEQDADASHMPARAGHLLELGELGLQL